MSNIEMMIEQPSVNLNYQEPYKKIADKMRELGLFEIGSISEAVEGESERARSMDMDSTARAGRATMLVTMTNAEIEKVHAWELKNGRWCYNFKKIIGRPCNPLPLSRDSAEKVLEFANEYRPKCEKLEGVSIPPYFPLDLSFDGMTYHHAWDKCIWMNSSKLGDIETKTKGENALY